MNKRNRRTDGEHEAAKGQGKHAWVVVALDVAKAEGRKILSAVQYEHIKEILQRLVDFGDKEELSDLSIEQIGSFWELREKGGVLGRINLRVYFGTLPEDWELVVAKTYKKEDNGKTPQHIVEQVEDRLEVYKLGGRKKSDTVYEKEAVRK
jgi:hypothetical protein